MTLRPCARRSFVWVPILCALSAASACTEATETDSEADAGLDPAPTATQPGETTTSSTSPSSTTTPSDPSDDDSDPGSGETDPEGEPNTSTPNTTDSDSTDATDDGDSDGDLFDPSTDDVDGDDNSEPTSSAPTSTDQGGPDDDQAEPPTRDDATTSDVNPPPQDAGSAEPPRDASTETDTDSTQPNNSDCDSEPSNYDDVVLCDGPVGYWALSANGEAETDLSGNGHNGEYQGGSPETSTLPNGDNAADFDGESQYLSIDSAPEFSIPTTGTLTWEAWIQPAVVNFPNNSNDYVDWMGKCAEYAPTCEWEARMYNADSERCNRLSAYAFNPGADLGSGAYFEQECGSIQPGDWVHVVGQYTLLWQPDACSDAAQYPGSIEIWVNGVKWDQSAHGQTGCMSQYQVAPEANDSPINVGTMAGDAWFEGAIGKLAIYDYLLDEDQIAAHYRAMTGQEPSGL